MHILASGKPLKRTLIRVRSFVHDLQKIGDLRRVEEQQMPGLVDFHLQEKSSKVNDEFGARRQKA